MIDYFLQLTPDKLIELTAAVLSLLYLYLEVKENPWLWFVGIISSGIYTYVYFKNAFYADFGLMVYYVIISIYGWYFWIKGAQVTEKSELPIQRINWKQTIVLTLTGVVIYTVLLVILLYIPEYLDLSSSSFPYMDSFTVTASIIATWMLTRKILEQWILWIIINVLSVFMFWLKDMNYTMLLFVIYSVGAVIGYIRWIKHYQGQNET